MCGCLPCEHEEYSCIGCYATCRNNPTDTTSCCCWILGWKDWGTTPFSSHKSYEETVCCLGPCSVGCGTKKSEDIKTNKEYVTRWWQFWMPFVSIDKEKTEKETTITINISSPCYGMSKETKIVSNPTFEELPSG